MGIRFPAGSGERSPLLIGVERKKDERDKCNLLQSAGQEGQAHPAQKTREGQQEH